MHSTRNSVQNRSHAFVLVLRTELGEYRLGLQAQIDQSAAEHREPVEHLLGHHVHFTILDRIRPQSARTNKYIIIQPLGTACSHTNSPFGQGGRSWPQSRVQGVLVHLFRPQARLSSENLQAMETVQDGPFE